MKYLFKIHKSLRLLHCKLLDRNFRPVGHNIRYLVLPYNHALVMLIVFPFFLELFKLLELLKLLFLDFPGFLISLFLNRRFLLRIHCRNLVLKALDRIRL